MEKQNPARTSRRLMGLTVGDYVVYIGKEYSEGFKKEFIYKILSIDKNDIETDNWPYLLIYSPENTCWVQSTALKKATKQEYIVAKLKGKLYE